MTRIETIFFDMGGTLETLAYDDELRRRAMEGLLRFLKDHDVDPGCSTHAFCEAVSEGLFEYRAWNSNSLVELPTDRICSEFILRDFGLPSERVAAVSEEFMLLLEMQFYDREARPEAAAVLASLRACGMKLGVISNVMSRSCVPENLKRYGLGGDFDVLVASSVYGRRKPDPRIFLFAAQEIGSPPERCAHVGDKTSRDILGAIRAGFGLTIRVEHPEIDGTEPAEPAADALVEDLTGVIEVIARANTASAPGKIGTGDRPVKAILFDAGDILYYRPRRGEHLARFLASCDLDSKAAATAESKSAKDQAMTGRMSKREYMEFRLRSMGIEDEMHVDRGIAALVKDSETVAFFDGARETLHELKRRGYRLGIITDTYHARETKLEWLRRNGMDEVWDVFVSSCEEGVRKPDPAIYHAALNRLGLSPSEASFVGHKRSELDGARAIGMSTVAFNYETDVEADHVVEQFSGLLALFPSVNGGERR